MASKSKPMRFGLVFLGLCFFANPYLAAIDFLPDAIGCLLIWLGLSRLALLTPAARDAQKAFLRLACVDALKLLMLVVVFGMGSGTAEQPTALLVIAFSTGVLELFFLFPALRALFDAFFVIASHYDCKRLYANPCGGLSATDSICRLSTVFVVVREVVCLLPEMTSLTTSSFSDSFWDRIYDFIGAMRVLAFLFVLLCGIYWLVRLSWYFHRVRKEKEMADALGERYRAYYDSHPGIPVKCRHAVAFAFLTAGAILLVDFYLDFENVLPDYVAGILICLGALLTMSATPLRLICAALSGAYAAVSYSSSELSYSFVYNHSPSAIGKNHEVDLAYAEMWGRALVEMIVFLALLVCLLLLIRAVVRDWAGYRAECEEEFEGRKHREMLSYFDGQLIICGVLGFLAALLSFLYDYIQTPSGEGIYHFLDFLWIFDFGFSVIFAVFLGVLLVRVYCEIKNRYRYD